MCVCRETVENTACHRACINCTIEQSIQIGSAESGAHVHRGAMHQRHNWNRDKKCCDRADVTPHAVAAIAKPMVKWTVYLWSREDVVSIRTDKCSFVSHPREWRNFIHRGRILTYTRHSAASAGDDNHRGWQLAGSKPNTTSWKIVRVVISCAGRREIREMDTSSWARKIQINKSIHDECRLHRRVRFVRLFKSEKQTHTHRGWDKGRAAARRMQNNNNGIKMKSFIVEAIGSRSRALLCRNWP